MVDDAMNGYTMAVSVYIIKTESYLSHPRQSR